MNAWEFMSLWEVDILLEPHRTKSPQKPAETEAGGEESKAPPLTKWDDEKKENWSVNPEAEEYYQANGGEILFYPFRKWGPTDLRHTYYMKRRERPMVPAPHSCPMPDKQYDWKDGIACT